MKFSLPRSSGFQVCSGHCLQVGTETRVDWQKLGLLGAVSLQQLMGGASQQQGDTYRAVAPSAASGNIAGLRLWISVFLRRRWLSALVYFWHCLCSAGLPCVQCVEQVFNHPHGTAHPWPLRGDRLQQLTKRVLVDFLLCTRKKKNEKKTDQTELMFLVYIPNQAFVEIIIWII